MRLTIKYGFSRVGDFFKYSFEIEFFHEQVNIKNYFQISKMEIIFKIK